MQAGQGKIKKFILKKHPPPGIRRGSGFAIRGGQVLHGGSARLSLAHKEGGNQDLRFGIAESGTADNAA